MDEGWQEGRRLGLHEARVENERRAREMVVAYDRLMDRLQATLDDLEQDPLFLAYMQHPLVRQICRRYIGERVSVFRSIRCR